MSMQISEPTVFVDDIGGGSDLAIRSAVTLSAFLNGNVAHITAGDTFTVPFPGGGINDEYLNVTDSQMAMPCDITLLTMSLRITSPQPASGSFSITIQKNAVDTNISCVIPAGSPPGTVVIARGRAAFVAGDLCNLKMHNDAADISALYAGVLAVGFMVVRTG